MTVPAISTTQSVGVNLDPDTLSSLPVSAWMQTFYASGVQSEVMQWLLAQGWQIASVANDTSTVPPTPYYTVTRQGMANSAVLQSLVNTYTNAINEGRELNAKRYNNIVTNWGIFLDSCNTDLANQRNEANAFATVFLTTRESAVASIRSKIASQETALQTYVSDLWSKVDDFSVKLNDLETNYTSAAASIELHINAESTALASFLSQHETKLSGMETALTSYAALIRSDLVSLLSDHTEFVSDAETIRNVSQSQLTAHIADIAAQLSFLSSEYDAHASTIAGLLATSGTEFYVFRGSVDGLLASLLTDYATHQTTTTNLLAEANSVFSGHETDYQGALAALLSDWTAHYSVASNLLTNLGTTETARINEQFDNRLSAAGQELVDRGLYNSVLLTSINARVERERNEALSQLNDRLNREKLDNEHRLYEQKVGVRTKTIDGIDRLYSFNQEVLRYKAETLARLYSQLEDTRNRTLTAKQSVHSVRQEVLRFETEMQGNLYARINAVRTRTMEAKTVLFQLQDALQRWRMEVRQRESTMGMEAYRTAAQVHESLLRVVEDVTAKVADGVEREHAARQQVEQAEITQRDRLLTHLQDATGKVLDGKTRANQLRQSNGEFMDGGMNRLIAMQMQLEVANLDQMHKKHGHEMELYKYQIDTHNNVVLGLFGFQERRTDSYPGLEVMAQLCSQLGDSGATSWVTP